MDKVHHRGQRRTEGGATAWFGNPSRHVLEGLAALLHTMKYDTYRPWTSILRDPSACSNRPLSDRGLVHFGRRHWLGCLCACGTTRTLEIRPG